MKLPRNKSTEPEVQVVLELQIPVGFELESSLMSMSDPAEAAERLIDVFGSAVAEATGWQPPDGEDSVDV